LIRRERIRTASLGSHRAALVMTLGFGEGEEAEGHYGGSKQCRCVEPHGCGCLAVGREYERRDMMRGAKVFIHVAP
jgi:hypothetical protein